MDPNTIVPVFAFTVLALLWLAFAYALCFNRAALNSTWQATTRWPVLARVTVALLILPVYAGLWIWQAKWPAWLRLVLIAGLAWVTIYTFYPAAAAAF